MTAACPETIAGMISGNVTENNVANALAPDISAASSRLGIHVAQRRTR
jgi:hypothetical protein